MTEHNIIKRAEWSTWVESKKVYLEKGIDEDPNGSYQVAISGIESSLLSWLQGLGVNTTQLESYITEANTRIANGTGPEYLEPLTESLLLIKSL